ncbi:TPA: hypothetical protein N0F65_007698 [Lagenidium giganteum]|uniref:C-factor n=1 Tax=Lagenidium giganteum TaxID=4803 RepID=A0AAV2Z5C0_9STRA|nr:TPA: hypothetical protein N0F65_007698 [Lagenidium giganteum]
MASVQTVLVTGATRGIGLCFAKHYVQRGWKVIATARSMSTAQELLTLNVYKVITMDTADEQSIVRAATELEGEAVHLLINNAGILCSTTLLSTTKEDLMKQFEVNAVGPLLVTRAFLPHLKRAVQETGASSVGAEISSQLGSIERTYGGRYGYRGSKSAVNMFMKSLAVDLKDDHIAVVILHPGIVKTDMNNHQGPVSPDDSVCGMIKAIDSVTLATSGSFTPCPTTVQPKPVENGKTPCPTSVKPNPDEHGKTPCPTTAKPKPVENGKTPCPTTAKPKPVENGKTPCPTTAKPKPTPCPTTAKPKPVENGKTPCPTTAKPKPVENGKTPCPTTAKPKPVENGKTPCPTSVKPNPVEHGKTPCPTTAKPKPVENGKTPCPTTAKPKVVEQAKTPCPTTAKPKPYSRSQMTNSNKTVLVTGATRGIGLQFVKQYVEDGWRVIATSRTHEGAGELKALNPYKVVIMNVSDEQSILDAARELNGEAIDLLINNAGVLYYTALDTTTKEDLMKQFEVNAVGPLLVTRAFLPHLKRAVVTTGNPSIVAVVTSEFGSIESTTGGFYGYRSSKSAVNMLMKTLAIDLQQDRVAVVMLHPGVVKTDMSRHMGPVLPEDSVNGMVRVIAGVTEATSGEFRSYDGAVIPW